MTVKIAYLPVVCTLDKYDDNHGLELDKKSLFTFASLLYVGTGRLLGLPETPFFAKVKQKHKPTRKSNKTCGRRAVSDSSCISADEEVEQHHAVPHLLARVCYKRPLALDRFSSLFVGS